MSTTQSEFLDWFGRQFGRCEGYGWRGMTDTELRNHISAGQRAAAELERRKLWDELEQAAMHAWCARDNRGANDQA